MTQSNKFTKSVRGRSVDEYSIVTTKLKSQYHNIIKEVKQKRKRLRIRPGQAKPLCLAMVTLCILFEAAHASTWLEWFGIAQPQAEPSLMTSRLQYCVERGWQIKEKLGSGAFGVVRKISADGKEYALKAIKVDPDWCVTKSLEKVTTMTAKQWTAEVKYLKETKHPNILTPYNCWVEKCGDFVANSFFGDGAVDPHNDVIFMQLDLCDSDVKKAVERTDSFLRTPKQRFDVFTQMVEGIKFLHSEGLIHRDIKHENILLKLKDGKYVAKVADLGCCIKTTRDGRHCKKCHSRLGLCKHSKGFGDPRYMAPEMKRRRAYTNKVDMYSLGTVLRKMFAPGTNPRADVICGNLLGDASRRWSAADCLQYLVSGRRPTPRNRHTSRSIQIPRQTSRNATRWRNCSRHPLCYFRPSGASPHDPPPLSERYIVGTSRFNVQPAAFVKVIKVFRAWLLCENGYYLSRFHLGECKKCCSEFECPHPRYSGGPIAIRRAIPQRERGRTWLGNLLGG